MEKPQGGKCLSKVVVAIAILVLFLAALSWYGENSVSVEVCSTEDVKNPAGVRGTVVKNPLKEAEKKPKSAEKKPKPKAKRKQRTQPKRKMVAAVTTPVSQPQKLRDPYEDVDKDFNRSTVVRETRKAKPVAQTAIVVINNVHPVGPAYAVQRGCGYYGNRPCWTGTGQTVSGGYVAIQQPTVIVQQPPVVVAPPSVVAVPPAEVPPPSVVAVPPVQVSPPSVAPVPSTHIAPPSVAAR